MTGIPARWRLGTAVPEGAGRLPLAGGGALLAFLRRDAFFHISYRFGFALDLLSILLSTSTFYFMGRLVSPAAPPSLEPYGGDYFSFALIGVAFSAYQSVCLHSLSQSIRKEQLFGTLESVLTSSVSLPAVVLASSQWEFLYATVKVGLSLGAGILFFGLSFPSVDIPAAVLILGLTMAAFLSVGMVSAAFILRFKRGDPAAWSIAAASDLLGGVYFPLALLPEPLRALSQALPLTHSLEGLRAVFLQSAGMAQVLPQALALLAFSAVFGPIGIWGLGVALRQARQDGSLGHY